MSDNQRVYVSILDKEYQIACPANEREALHKAARELDSRMRAIRNSGTIVGIERIAVMAALNLCHELNKNRDESLNEAQHTHSSLNKIIEKLNSALLQN
ncbi:MAG: cell division protein ZapA [Cellvibrionaceae bacterium]|nr:cell division protein ZapA [Cellvibrionaceae bacterium]